MQTVYLHGHGVKRYRIQGCSARARALARRVRSRARARAVARAGRNAGHETVAVVGRGAAGLDAVADEVADADEDGLHVARTALALAG